VTYSSRIRINIIILKCTNWSNTIVKTLQRQVFAQLCRCDTRVKDVDTTYVYNHSCDIRTSWTLLRRNTKVHRTT